MVNQSSFGIRLREWRRRRGLSQLDLAGAAGTTQRHLSFLESGRSQPSPEMVLRLAATLDIPLRQQNALLLAAGFAPVWQERDLTAPDLESVNRALDYMLAQQEPFPAIVVDRRWNLLRANAGAARLTTFLTGPLPTAPVNIAEWLISPALRPMLVNWQDVVLHLLRGVQADALLDGAAETEALLQRLLTAPGAPTWAQAPEMEAPQPPVLALHFRKGAASLRLFTTIATLGAPQDITAQDLRIECFFPVDEATAEWFRNRDASAPREPGVAE